MAKKGVTAEPDGAALVPADSYVNDGMARVRELMRDMIRAGVATEIQEGRTRVVENCLTVIEGRLNEIEARANRLCEDVEAARGPAHLQVLLAKVAAQKQLYKAWLLEATTLGENRLPAGEVDAIVNAMFDNMVAAAAEKANQRFVKARPR